MATLKSKSNGELDINPSKTSSQNDFDRLVGKWNIHHRKLVSRLTNSDEWIEFYATQEMRKVLNGLGNVETMAASINGIPFEGMAVRLFNPATKLWSIYWSDSSSGILDKPVVGSFANNIGRFYSKEIFNNREVIQQFQWDISNPERPVWSQAYSTDKGETWEWNWYMYFTRRNSTEEAQVVTAGGPVIELRNYLIKPHMREAFIEYFERHFIQSQNEIGGQILGQYKVKDARDQFFWIRGFSDMSGRNKFLNDFYHGPFWQQHKATANSMLLNNDNVHLLKPLNFAAGSGASFDLSWFRQEKGIAVIDYYIANQKLDKLFGFVHKEYLSLLTAAGIDKTSFWISETATNEFTALPVFQDTNLIQISFYADEAEYAAKLKVLDTLITPELRIEMADIVTSKTTQILVPARSTTA